MKLKYEFETVELDGNVMAVPVGENATELHAMLRLNDVAAFIMDCLKEETTEEEIIKKVSESYEGDAEDIKKGVTGFIAQLKEKDLI